VITGTDEGEKMNCIVAADRNWGIGKSGKLLVSIPEDMKFFRKMTTGKTVICGRKTLESFPGGKPLPNRRNIILTHQKDFAVPGALVVHTPEEAMKAAADEKPEDVFVIGGASVYKQLLPYCDTAYVTKIDYAYEADAYFPDLDLAPEWKMSVRGEEQTCFDLIYEFDTYERA